jgi:hypothetical protein
VQGAPGAVEQMIMRRRRRAIPYFKFQRVSIAM